MRTRNRVSCFISWSALALTASALGAAPGSELQFSDIGAVKEWKAGGDTTVFVRDKDGQWYKAEMFEACMALDTTGGVRFLTEIEPVTKDRMSKVVVGRRICTVSSLAKVPDPPARAK